MARYDFVCGECGHVFEVLTTQGITERQKKCPQCGSRSVRQKFWSYLRNGPADESAACAPRGFG
ncbi:MAG TPA: zinc ribbon domain-containing protein [Thermoleophilia bacterium]|nr:zinc ribbon domain-containing protein [Thermoleophilia bacterium]